MLIYNLLNYVQNYMNFKDFKSHSRSESYYSNHPGSIVVVVIWELFLKSLHILTSISCGCFLDGTLRDLLKTGYHPIFNVIIGKFVNFFTNLFHSECFPLFSRNYEWLCVILVSS